jgi:ABC-2 type transport system permease protein
MIRSMQAELLKLRRPAVVYGAAGSMLGFALLATVLTFATATATATQGNSPVGGDTLTSTLTQLGHSGGLTRGFSIAAGFIGLLTFVLFTTSVTREYGLGTVRVMLVREPRRARLLTGKLLALVACVAAVLLAAELVSSAAALALAHWRGIPTDNWFSTDGMRAFAGDYANAVLTATFFGTIGAVLGLLARSTPLALGIGLAWLGPIEHIIQLNWDGAARWFPGLIFDAVANGGTTLTTYQHATTIAVVYVAVAMLIGTASFLRRDVSV